MPVERGCPFPVLSFAHKNLFQDQNNSEILERLLKWQLSGLPSFFVLLHDQSSWQPSSALALT